MPDPCIAAVCYRSGPTTKGILKSFVQQMLNQGVDVQGLLQENLLNDDGSRWGVDAVDIKTNAHIPLMRPTQFERDNKRCSLNLAQLTEATEVLRRALESSAELCVVERFSKTESDGGGLADDLMALMASGIPTVISVHEDEYEAWLHYSGGLAEPVDGTLTALMAWWDRAHAPS